MKAKKSKSVTLADKITAVLTTEPQTQGQIRAALKLETTCYDMLNALVKRGVAEKVKATIDGKQSKAWKLAPVTDKPKAKKRKAVPAAVAAGR